MDYSWWAAPGSEYYNADFRNDAVAKSVKAYLSSDVRFIISLRSPVSRAISAYMHHLRAGRLSGHDRILDADKRFGIIDIGFYQRHIEYWQPHFDTKQFCFVKFESISSAPDDAARKLFEFLAIDPEQPVLMEKKYGLRPRGKKRLSSLE